MRHRVTFASSALALSSLLTQTRGVHPSRAVSPSDRVGLELCADSYGEVCWSSACWPRRSARHRDTSGALQSGGANHELGPAMQSRCAGLAALDSIFRLIVAAALCGRLRGAQRACMLGNPPRQAAGCYSALCNATFSSTKRVRVDHPKYRAHTRGAARCVVGEAPKLRTDSIVRHLRGIELSPPARSDGGGVPSYLEEQYRITRKIGRVSTSKPVAVDTEPPSLNATSPLGRELKMRQLALTPGVRMPRDPQCWCSTP